MFTPIEIDTNQLVFKFDNLPVIEDNEPLHFNMRFLPQHVENLFLESIEVFSEVKKKQPEADHFIEVQDWELARPLQDE